MGDSIFAVVAGSGWSAAGVSVRASCTMRARSAESRFTTAKSRTSGGAGLRRTQFWEPGWLSDRVSRRATATRTAARPMASASTASLFALKRGHGHRDDEDDGPGGSPGRVDRISRAAVIAAASFSGCGGYEAPPSGWAIQPERPGRSVSGTDHVSDCERSAGGDQVHQGCAGQKGRTCESPGRVARRGPGMCSGGSGVWCRAGGPLLGRPPRPCRQQYRLDSGASSTMAPAAGSGRGRRRGVRRGQGGSQGAGSGMAALRTMASAVTRRV